MKTIAIGYKVSLFSLLQINYLQSLLISTKTSRLENSIDEEIIFKKKKCISDSQLLTVAPFLFPFLKSLYNYHF